MKVSCGQKQKDFTRAVSHERSLPIRQSGYDLIDTDDSDGRLEGMTASQTAIKKSQREDEGHASLGDKLTGNIKLAVGTITGNEEMKEEGIDLKNGDKDRLH